MRRTSGHLAVLILATAAAGWAAVTIDSDDQPMQQALAALRDGQCDQAENIASELASRTGSPRAWLVVAAAKQQRCDYQAAIEAYDQFLAIFPAGRLRSYAQAQLEQCRAAIEPTPVPPSDRISAEDRAEFSKVDKKTYTEISTHFVVRARNEQLAKSVATEAESALVRICDFLGKKGYASIIDINIWADHQEYRGHARHSPEWSGGSSLISKSDDGKLVRRIDLTQLDDDRRLDMTMLDQVLPHEMCHLVLKDHFGDASIPLFLNEGLAMLCEWRVDNGRVLLAGTALAGKAAITLDDLCAMQKLSDKVDVFYAESYSLVAYLQQRLTAEQFRALFVNVRHGCSLSDALHRALCLPHDPDLLAKIERAWQEDAITSAQVLRALQGSELSAVAP